MLQIIKLWVQISRVAVEYATRGKTTVSRRNWQGGGRVIIISRSHDAYCIIGNHRIMLYLIISERRDKA